METKIEILREKIKEEIILYKNSIASYENLEIAKDHFLNAKEAFVELQTLTNSYQVKLQEMMDEFIEVRQK